VRDYLKRKEECDLKIILRHDVDRRMDRAVRMAELENELGIRSTYYLRSIPKVFRPDAIRRLHELGHEVGYHYEVMSRADGDAEEAIALFEEDMRRFGEIVPVDTVSMHGSVFPLGQSSHCSF
jgi:hypothetical protein